MRCCQISGWWAKCAQDVRFPSGFIPGIILVMLLMMDLHAVRCGRSLDLGAGNQYERAFGRDGEQFN